MIRDALGRPLQSLRISVTDRCNLRCAYCMPEEEYRWLPREGMLRFEEVARLARIFAGLGVERIRLTGGEPLLRQDLPTLVEMLSGTPGLRDLALTTNGVLLARQARSLREAGLHRITVSLDTLRPDRFRRLGRQDALDRVLEGIEAARAAGFRDTKIDTVLLRGVNDDEIEDLLEFGRKVGAEVRFIEYMDVGGATRWTPQQVVSRADILERLGNPEPLAGRGSAPAERFRLPDGTVFGIVASTTTPFCRACDRSRLTADGQWLLCLYAVRGLDLRALLRKGVRDAHIARRITETWIRRDDRGAERRLELRERGALVPAEVLRSNPHLEMHTRGG